MVTERRPAYDIGSSELSLGTLLAPFIAIAALMAVDLATDFHHGGDLWHLVGEGLIMVAAVWGAYLLWRDRTRARRAAAELTVQVADAQAQAEALREQNELFREEADAATRGLRDAIDAQFERWGLTPAETEVALLLLKGLSLKELAAVRNTTERTARQQSLSIYRKANLAGRAELSAYFLEDLFDPRPPAAPAQAS